MLEKPPVVTILGHVDHGKTSLLDFIRSSEVAKKEYGGITQHIGAYQVEHQAKKITFIDTPGHAAFEKMRSRGAQAGDISVLVVAVDDGVMPQTVEAIRHILAAKTKMIVAVNKIDLPGIDKQVQIQKIKKQLSDNGVLVEEYGGDVPIVELSAKTGEGVDKLLEMITLVAEMSELKADPKGILEGVVIEAKLDKNKGPVATLLIRDGTLKKGEELLVGGVKGKVKGLFDEFGKSLEEATPAAAVEVLGLSSVPSVGAIVGEQATSEKKDKAFLSLVEKLRTDESKILSVVVKADNQGSLEAIEEALNKLNEDATHIEIIASATGDIGDNDIKLASSSRAIVVGFNVGLSNSASKAAELDRVLVRTYKVIYELIDEVREVVEGMLKAGALEEVFGTASVLAEFPYGKNERIAGARMLDGVISKGPKLRVVRGDPSTSSGQVIGEAKIKSLKKNKEEISKVEKGQEFGVLMDPAVDFAIGDKLESFRTF